MATETIFQVLQKQKLANTVQAALPVQSVVEELRHDLVLGVETVEFDLSAITLPSLILVAADKNIEMVLYPSVGDGLPAPLEFKGLLFMYAPDTYTVPAIPAAAGSPEVPEVPEVPPQKYDKIVVSSLSEATALTVRVMGI